MSALSSENPNTAQNAADDPRYLSSVERGFRVLDALSSTGPMSLTELSRQTSLTVPTLQRLTSTLVGAGYLKKQSETKRYHSTVKTVDLLYSYLSRNQFAKRAWPHLVRLREELGLDVSLSVPISDSMIYVHRLPGYRGNFENTLPGKQIPMHLSASGRCLLASMSKEEIDFYLNTAPLTAMTNWSLTDQNAIRAEIQICRQKGYSLVKQETVLGLMTLACPVTSAAKTIAGISVHAPIAGLNQEQLLVDALHAVVTVSQAISTG